MSVSALPRQSLSRPRVVPLRADGVQHVGGTEAVLHPNRRHGDRHTDGNPISATDPPTATNTTAKDAVMPNCFSRQAVDSVYCSCRCANVNGQTNDGANYCTCPDSYTCTQLVSSTGGANEGLTGAYCVKVGTQFDPGTFVCDPCVPTGTTGHCGSAQGVQGI